MAKYKIIRFFKDREPPHHQRIVKRGLTLEQAQEHCRDRETSSSTCARTAGVRRTKNFGPWFDGYEEE
jgi:hypothetical protein